MAHVDGCLSENTIQELVAGTLSGEALARAQRHIDACSTCRMLVIALARDQHTESFGAGATLPQQDGPGLGPRRLAGRFEIVRPLGRGGMGVVYEALDRERGSRPRASAHRNAWPGSTCPR